MERDLWAKAQRHAKAKVWSAKMWVVAECFKWARHEGTQPKKHQKELEMWNCVKHLKVRSFELSDFRTTSFHPHFLRIFGPEDLCLINILEIRNSYTRSHVKPSSRTQASPKCVGKNVDNNSWSWRKQRFTESLNPWFNVGGSDSAHM